MQLVSRIHPKIAFSGTQSVPSMIGMAVDQTDTFQRLLPFAQYPGFDDGFINAVRQSIQGLTYGKDMEALLRRSRSLYRPFKVFSDGHELVLENYRQQTKGQGVCSELAYEVAEVLEKKMPEDVVLKVANGRGGQYFRGEGITHVFLLAYPKAAQTEIEKALKDKPDTIPEGVLVIDPSEQLFGLKGVDKEVSNYVLIHELLDVSDLAPDNFPGVKKTIKVGGARILNLPLGFRKDLIPDDDYPDSMAGDLIWLMFDFQFLPARVTVGVQPDWMDGAESDEYLLDSLPDDLPLKRFVEHVSDQLRRPYGEQAEDMRQFKRRLSTKSDHRDSRPCSEPGSS